MRLALPVALVCACLPAALGQTPDRLRRAAGATTAVHGGHVERTEAHRFEVVYGPDTIRVYAYDAEGHPVSARGIRGRIGVLVIRATNGGSRRGVNHQTTGADLSFQPADPKRGRLRDCLVARHTVGEAEVQGVRVDVELHDVAHEPRGDVSFRVEFATRSELRQWSCSAADCTSVVFADPGQCPRCEAKLVSRARAEGAPSGEDETTGDEPPAAGERPGRPWRRRR